MSEYTEADVEKDAASLEDTIGATFYEEDIRTEDRAQLARLRVAALEGAKVPGLVADNAALFAHIGAMEEALEACQSHIRQAATDYDVPFPASLMDEPPTLEAAHSVALKQRDAIQAKVSALQARLKEAEYEHTTHVWKTTEHVRALEARVAEEEANHKRTMGELDASEAEVTALRARVAELEQALEGMRQERDGEQDIAVGWEAKAHRLESERDALRAQVAQLQRSAGDLQVERNRASHYNDVLRQRFDTARNDALEEAAARIDMEAQESHTRETASLLDDVAKRVRDLKRAALSASPAETKKAPISDAEWCARAAAREGDSDVVTGPPAETTPAPDREKWSCNLHADCDASDSRARALGIAEGDEHCNDADCPDHQ